MPDELAEVLINQRDGEKDVKRQLGELDRVTGVLVEKKGNIKIIVKQYIIKTRDVNDSFILNHPTNGRLDVTPTGDRRGSWETYYDSGDLE